MNALRISMAYVKKNNPLGQSKNHVKQHHGPHKENHPEQMEPKGNPKFVDLLVTNHLYL
jgi:hypothetical protein